MLPTTFRAFLCTIAATRWAGIVAIVLVAVAVWAAFTRHPAMGAALLAGVLICGWSAYRLWARARIARNDADARQAAREEAEARPVEAIDRAAAAGQAVSARGLAFVEAALERLDTACLDGLRALLAGGRPEVPLPNRVWGALAAAGLTDAHPTQPRPIKKQIKAAVAAALARCLAQPLRILFDEADGRFVRLIGSPASPRGERYWIALRNMGDRPLHEVSLHAHEGRFVEFTIVPAHPRYSALGIGHDREPVVRELDILSPGASDFVELFGKGYDHGSVDDLFRAPNRFQLEAKARDTAAVVAEFAYDPDRRPMIRKLPSADVDLASIEASSARSQ